MAIDAALEQTEAQLQEMGQRVVSAVHGAMRALEERDRELADEVIAFDDEVDRHYLAIEHQIQSLLALQTPVARDLRLLLAMLHIDLLLERSADGCVTIAKLSRLVSDVEPDPALVETLTEMGERAEEMLRVAMGSFSRRDLAGAESLVELDELIDRANRRFVERLVDVMAEEEFREWGLRMVVVARTIERIGDRAVDIGEQTAYLLTAEFREFTGKVGDTQVRVLALPGHEWYAQEMVKIACEAIPVYDEWFGLYPYPQFTVVESYFGWNGNECGGLVMIDARCFDMPHIACQFVDHLLSHEICHQWWYNVVGTNGWPASPSPGSTPGRRSAPTTRPTPAECTRSATSRVWCSGCSRACPSCSRSRALDTRSSSRASSAGTSTRRSPTS